MAGRPLGFGIVGAGAIGPTHAAAVESNGARVVAVHDVVPERAAALAARHGARAYASLDEFLRDPDLDVVTVANASGAHADVAIPAAAAGKHLFIEKPLDVTLERAREIVAAATRAGVILSVVSQHRFDDSTIAAKRAIEAGALGRIAFAQAEVLWYRPQSYYDRDPWRGTWRLDGGGALMNQGIHSVDVLRYLAGDVASVRAVAGRRAHSGIEVEDVVVASVSFRSGALGAIVATTAAAPGFGARIEVYGDRGAARIEDDRIVSLADRETTLGGPGVEGAASDPAALGPQGHGRQVADLIDAIRAGRAPLVDGHEGLAALEIVLAVYRSAETGEAVDLPTKPRPAGFAPEPTPSRSAPGTDGAGSRP